MMCLCWLLLVVAACVCVPGFGSVCWQSSICNDLSNKEGILVGPFRVYFVFFVIAILEKGEEILLLKKVVKTCSGAFSYTA